MEIYTVNNLIEKLIKLDGEARIVVFSNNLFYQIKLDEYDCNCTEEPKIYYIAPDTTNLKERQFEV